MQESSRPIRLMRMRALWPLALVVAASVAGAQSPLPPDGTVRGELASRVDRHLSRAERYGFSGSVLVAHRGEVVLHKGYGLADRDSGRRMTAGTVVDIGSITKPFTAAAVMKLVDQGRLRITDSLARFFPAVPADKAAITVHHLLTHTAGLRSDFGGDYELITRDSLVAVALASPLAAAPGVRYSYSNVGYSLLAAIIERLTGLPYERALHALVLQPANVADIGYRSVDWSSRPLAVGYRGARRWGTPLDHRWADDGPSWHLRGNGGLLTTVGELYRWVTAFHSGRIISAESYRAATSPPAGGSYAYGWEVSRSDSGRRDINHTGGNGFFYARASHRPDDSLTIVFATNDASNRRLDLDVQELMLERPVPEIPGDVAAGVRLVPYVGRYRTAEGLEFEIRQVGEALEIARAPGRITAALLLPADAGGGADATRRSGRDTMLVEMVGAMARGDYSLYRRHFWDYGQYRIDGEVEFWTEVLTDWRASYGDLREVRVLGAAETRAGPGPVLATYLALRYADGERVLRVFQQLPPAADDRYFVATVSGPQWPDRFVFSPRSRTEFVTYVPELRRIAAVEFSLDERGAVEAVSLPGGLRAAIVPR